MVTWSYNHVTLDIRLSIHPTNISWALILCQAVCQALPMRALPLGGSQSSRGNRQCLNKQKSRSFQTVIFALKKVNTRVWGGAVRRVILERSTSLEEVTFA